MTDDAEVEDPFISERPETRRLRVLYPVLDSPSTAIVAASLARGPRPAC